MTLPDGDRITSVDVVPKLEDVKEPQLLAFCEALRELFADYPAPSEPLRGYGCDYNRRTALRRAAEYTMRHGRGPDSISQAARMSCFWALDSGVPNGEIFAAFMLVFANNVVGR